MINEREVQMLRFATRAIFAFFLFAGARLSAENLSPLAEKPHWEMLEQYQETITREQFTHLLQNVYATRGYDNLIEIGEGTARIVEEQATQQSFTLRFAPEKPRKIPRPYWRAIEKLPLRSANNPLAHLNVALDPGHLGGSWAKMEERWFQIGNQPPVEEGEMTWQVAKILAEKLRALGADVTFVRQHDHPTTPKRPDDFRELAKTILEKSGVSEPRDDYEDLHGEEKLKSIRWQSELLFYRQSEIHYRARRVNKILQPDLVLCLHFNAEGWGDPTNPTMLDRNHFHVLLNGSYLPDEITHDDERYEMIRRLLSRAYEEELPLADAMASTFARETGLAPYEYTTDTVNKVGASGYVYTRNLLATRLFQCPVVYFEPYVMNGNDAYARIQAGDYDGTREFNGMQRPSIFHEYAQAVADGLAEYCRAKRASSRAENIARDLSNGEN